jgi:glycosyltransferase involved in cell wall biosynthesis
MISRWFRRKPAIHYVYDGSQWSFYWDAFYITQGLRENHDLKTHITTKPWKLRGQIIQFGDRYGYLKGDFRGLHPSNKVFLTWFHGDLDDPNPDIQELFALLPDALPYLEKIVVPCRITRDVLLQTGVPESQLVTIPLGVDLQLFKLPTPQQRRTIRAALGIPENAICIGSFQKDGRGWGDGMEPKLVKGPDIFLEVIADLAKQYRNLVVLLTGPARGYVRQGLEKIGVPYVHRYLDDYREIAPLYHALNTYLITSRSEGGPKALMESWASGVPVVSTPMGMPADYIRQGENGWLADPAGLAEGIRRLIEDQTLREGCIQQALADVQALDWKMVAEGYFEMYQEFF